MWVFVKLGAMSSTYSKIDLKKSYNQFQLHDTSQELTSINTEKGLLKYTLGIYAALFVRSEWDFKSRYEVIYLIKYRLMY